MPLVPPSRPWIIAHRGASALRPEHTLAAYALAIEHGADAIEPDLVMTRDGVLVARHENALSDSTDVARRPEFASRRRRQQIDGAWMEDWFTEDFTLTELKTLRAVERLPALRSTEWDGQFEVPAFDEIVSLVADESAKRGRLIGLVPEIKHPSHFAALGLAMEQPLLDALEAHEYTRRAPIVIQSFETANLRWLHARLKRSGRVRLLQLVGAPDAAPFDTVLAGTPRTYGAMLTQGLRDIATYADAIGPHYRMLQIQPLPDGTGFRSDLVDAAHAVGLQVIAYTFRPESTFIEERFRKAVPGSFSPADETAARRPSHRREKMNLVPLLDPEGAVGELRAYVSTGLAGLFTDDPRLACRALGVDNCRGALQD